MGWSIGYDTNWKRDVGYGVPAHCDMPGCAETIHRGLSYVCGGDVFGGEHGCGLFFCETHMRVRRPRGSDRDVPLCPRCYAYRRPFTPKQDHPEWIGWKLTDDSWAEWRALHPEFVAANASLPTSNTGDAA